MANEGTSSKNLWAMACCLLAALLAGVIGYFLGVGQTKPSTPTPSSAMSDFDRAAVQRLVDEAKRRAAVSAAPTPPLTFPGVSQPALEKAVEEARQKARRAVAEKEAAAAN